MKAIISWVLKRYFNWNLKTIWNRLDLFAIILFFNLHFIYLWFEMDISKLLFLFLDSQLLEFFLLSSSQFYQMIFSGLMSLGFFGVALSESHGSFWERRFECKILSFALQNLISDLCPSFSIWIRNKFFTLKVSKYSLIKSKRTMHFQNFTFKTFNILSF